MGGPKTLNVFVKPSYCLLKRGPESLFLVRFQYLSPWASWKVTQPHLYIKSKNNVCQPSSTFTYLASISHFLWLIIEIKEGLRSHIITWSSKKWPYKTQTIYVFDFMSRLGFLTSQLAQGPRYWNLTKIRFQDLFLEGNIRASQIHLPQSFENIGTLITNDSWYDSWWQLAYGRSACRWQLMISAYPWQLIWQLTNDSWWQLTNEGWYDSLSMTADDISISMTADMTACY